MVRASRFASALLLAAVSMTTAGVASAQVGTGVKLPPPGSPPAPMITVGLSEAELLNVLRSFDPNVKTQKVKNGIDYFLTVERDGWRYVLRIESFVGQVWVDASLGSPISNPDLLPAPVLSKLLQTNFTISPTFFSFDRMSDGRVLLNLGRVMERGALTPDRLRATIEVFCRQIRETHPTWSAVQTAVH